MSHATRLLTEESGTSERIKSRVTRQSVQAALASAQSRLRAITKLPETGLALFCGIVDDKRIVMAIEPPKPLTHFSYLCDSRFHTEELETMLREDSVYGFVVIDGQGALFATLSGSTRNIIQV